MRNSPARHTGLWVTIQTRDCRESSFVISRTTPGRRPMANFCTISASASTGIPICATSLLHPWRWWRERLGGGGRAGRGGRPPRDAPHSGLQHGAPAGGRQRPSDGLPRVPGAAAAGMKKKREKNALPAAGAPPQASHTAGCNPQWWKPPSNAPDPTVDTRQRNRLPDLVPGPQSWLITGRPGRRRCCTHSRTTSTAA